MRKYKKTYQWRKPNPPEHICAKEGCNNEALYRAPASRHLNGSYQFFCLEHIKEFNRSWNYFEGMSEYQLENELEKSRFRGETWPMGTSNAAKKIHLNAHQIKDPFSFFSTSIDIKAPPADNPWNDISAEEIEAMATLGLEAPFESLELRKAYRKMARIFHPDSADYKGNSDMIKKINQAYDLLKKTLLRHKKI